MGRRILMLWLLGLTSLWTTPLQAGELVLTYPPPEFKSDARHPYFLALLQLALDHTVAEEGPYRLQPLANVAQQSRAFRLLGNKQLDVMWSMTSREREHAYLPVRIPLMKGLLGYRVILINRQDAAIFEGMDEQNLKEVTCYQGHDWPDLEILAFNGFQVRGVANYLRIFTMLDRGMIDCFPRGILEAWGEIESQQLQNTVVDSRFVLIYPTAIYFFVHQDNHALASRLERGLRAALADGSFDRLLYGYPPHKEALARANLDQRVKVVLQNPLLPAQTPLSEPALWHHGQGVPLDKP